MEDYKFLIYIVGFILYSLFKAFNKKNKPVTRKKRPSSNQDEQSSPKTFEEILAELSGENKEAGQSVLEETDRIETEERPLDQKISRAEYENADSTLKELYEKGEKLKTLNELVDIEKMETKSRFSAYNQLSSDNSLAAEIREDFENPDTVKKAFIYSEIFNRKY